MAFCLLYQSIGGKDISVCEILYFLYIRNKRFFYKQIYYNPYFFLREIYWKMYPINTGYTLNFINNV